VKDVATLLPPGLPVSVTVSVIVAEPAPVPPLMVMMQIPPLTEPGVTEGGDVIHAPVF
jgi:hypothetical protein